MRFGVEQEVFARFPGLRLVVATASGLDNQVARPAIEALWQGTWQAAALAAAPYGNAQAHPRLRPWRERFTAMGISGKQFPSSAEALLRRAMKGGPPFHINPLVDWYNAISLRHLVPVGAFNLAQIAGPLELRLTRAGDRFTALDAAAPEQATPELATPELATPELATPETVAPGEVAYCDGPTVLTRHFVWRQAREGLVTPTTRAVFVVSEVLGEVGAEVASAVARDVAEGLATYFHVVTRARVLDAEDAATTW